MLNMVMIHLIQVLRRERELAVFVPISKLLVVGPLEGTVGEPSRVSVHGTSGVCAVARVGALDAGSLHAIVARGRVIEDLKTWNLRFYMER